MTLAYIGSPTLFWWGLIMTAGYVVAIPFGVWLAAPGLGRAMAASRLCAIPEEYETPAEIRAVQGATA
jgi:membrane glycosyltransferase